MWKQYGIYFDAKRCVQCHACELACKSLNGIEPGVKWRMVFDVWGGRFPNVWSKSISFACLHCAKPACEAACPAGAIARRSNGIVAVDKSRCIGCHACLIACPFGIPQFGRDGGMQKCHLCADRLKDGREPACVSTCPAEALQFGTLEELNKMAAEKAARRLAFDAAIDRKTVVRRLGLSTLNNAHECENKR